MKAAFQKLNEPIVPGKDLQDRVFEKIEHKRVARLRPLTAVAAVLAVSLLATPVMASEAVQDLMYQVSPEMAARFTPIRESDTDNGIKMEVVSASIHGSTAEICISFEDLEGDRLSRNSMAELYHTQFAGRAILRSGSWGGTIRDVDFDEETGKLILILERTFSFYDEEAGRNLTVQELFDGKMTIQVDTLYELVEQPEVEIPFGLTDNEVITVKIDRSKPTDRPVEVPFDGFGSGSVAGDPWLMQESYEILEPGEAVYDITDTLSLTGVGYAEGQLHIQTRVRADVNEEPVYDLWLVDEAGKEVFRQRHHTFVINEGENRGGYEEVIFDIPQEELENYTLVFRVSERQNIDGNWKVDFRFNESDYLGEYDDGMPLETAPTA